MISAEEARCLTADSADVKLDWLQFIMNRISFAIEKAAQAGEIERSIKRSALRCDDNDVDAIVRRLRDVYKYDVNVKADNSEITISWAPQDTAPTEEPL